MSQYLYHQQLKQIWEKAVSLYQSGQRGSETFFDSPESAFLTSIGHSAQEVYDFAEDFINHGEPDFETFLLVADIRRQYFQHEMCGQAGSKVVDAGDLPPKTDSVRGIEWLPRLIEKARAKLRGEMSSDLMYGCGGDRKFFTAHGLHPAEFLGYVRDHLEDDDAIIDFVEARSKATAIS
ncbi:MAG: DUF5069 domain-containing protein [Opitutales bacterium]|jgi:hypothetical protein